MQLLGLIYVTYIAFITFANSFVLPRVPRGWNLIALSSSGDTPRVSETYKDGFGFMKLDPIIEANLAAQNIFEPRRIQIDGFNAICDNGATNVLLSAETGCGKTLAYTLPLLRLITSKEAFVANPRAVIMAPTHLLVHQLYHVLSKVIKGSGITVAMEDDIETQEMPSIVIGTPLKLLSKFKIYNLNFKVDVFQNIGILVLDEADQLIEETNEAALREFLKLARNRAKTVLAAATVSNAGRLSTENTIARLFRKLKVVRTDAVHSIPTHIDAEFVYCVDYNQKIETLLDVLQQVGSKERALIFCGSVESSKSLLHAMKAVNPRLDVGVVNRDVDLPTQLAALHPEHGNKFIVCTDTLARGIDLGNVNMVVQFDFPTNVLHYIHRAGRAGRNLQRCKTVLLWTDANREFHTLLYENRNNLTALFSRKRGLRKKLKRGVAITSHAPPEAGLDTNDSM